MSSASEAVIHCRGSTLNTAGCGREEFLVVKVGGSLLTDAVSFLNIARELKRFLGGRKAVVVVSAMKGVTDDLLRALNTDSNAYMRVRERYLNAAEALGGGSLRLRVEDMLGQLLHTLQACRNPSPVVVDEVLSYGERLSKELMFQALLNEGVDAGRVSALEVIKTNNVFGRASIIYGDTLEMLRNRLLPQLESREAVVMEGFIGSSAEGVTTTLGRGGSDYTAVAVGALLRASEVRIITDVPGIMSADPQYIRNARVVEELSLNEALEASRYNVKRMHPRTFHPLIVRPELVVTVGSWRSGTRILRRVRELGRPKVLVHKMRRGAFLIGMIGEGMPQHLFIRKALDVLDKNSIRVLGVFAHHSRPSINLIVDREDLNSALSVLHNEVLVGGD